MINGIGVGPELNNIGGLAGSPSLGAQESARTQGQEAQARVNALETEQQRTEDRQNRAVAAAVESEPPLTEDLGQNINVSA